MYRLNQPEYLDRQAIIEFERRDDSIIFAILDQGPGFEWQQYLDISPERALDSHGRGIALANMISFDRIEYRGCGNEVCVTVITRE